MLQYPMVEGKTSVCPGAPIYFIAMSVKTDLADLAKRYVDLWQEQLIASAADPDLANAFAWWWEALLPATGEGSIRGFGGERADPSSAPGPASAPAPSGERSGRVDELARRVAVLEERLAAMEAGARRRRGSPAPRGRRRGA
jgi:hypothetical protein